MNQYPLPGQPCRGRGIPRGSCGTDRLSCCREAMVVDAARGDLGGRGRGLRGGVPNPADVRGGSTAPVGPYNTDRETLTAAGDLVQTYSQLVTTTPILTRAIQDASADMTPAELALASRVTANDVTRFLTIRVQHTDPEMAATLANSPANRDHGTRLGRHEPAGGPTAAGRPGRASDRSDRPPEVADRRPGRACGTSPSARWSS